MASLMTWRPTPSASYQRIVRELARRHATGEITAADYEQQSSQAHQAWLRSWKRTYR